MKKSVKNKIVTAVLATAMLLTSVNAFAFSDVADDHWAADYIAKLTDKGYINGYEDGTFAPGNFITRAEFVTIINKVKGVSATSGKSFSDVKADAWYANEIDKAVTAGFITGYDDGTVRPDAYISRAEVAVVCYKAWDLTPESSADFADSNEIGSWAKQQVATLVAKNILSGYEDGTFKPNNAITRAEVAKIVACLIEMKDNTSEVTTTTTTPAPAGLSSTSVTIKGGSSGGGGGGGGSSSSSSNSAPTKTQLAALEDVADGTIDNTLLSTVVKYSNNSATVNKNFEDLYSDAVEELVAKLDSEYDDYDLSTKTDAKKFANDVSAVVLAVNKAATEVKSLAKNNKLDKSNLLDMQGKLEDIINSKATKDNRDDINEAMADFCSNLYNKISGMLDSLNGKTLTDSDLMKIYNGTYTGKSYTAPTSSEKTALSNVEKALEKDSTFSASNLNTIVKYAASNNEDYEGTSVKADSDLTFLYTDSLIDLMENNSYEKVSDMDAEEAAEFAMDITAVVDTVNTSVTIVKNLAENGNLDKEHLIEMKDSILLVAEVYASETNKEAVKNLVENKAVEIYAAVSDKLSEYNGIKDLTSKDIVDIYANSIAKG